MTESTESTGTFLKSILCNSHYSSARSVYSLHRPYESTMLRKSETGVRRKHRYDYENFAERGTMEIRYDSGGLF